jgi:hypothetical protein
MTVWPYTTSTSSTSPYVYKVYSQSGDWVFVPSDKNNMKMIKEEVSDLHKGVENLQDQIFTKGKIEVGCDIYKDEIEEPETPEEDLKYFDPKDLDI